MKKSIIYSYIDFEALFWISALLLLAFSDPNTTEHYTLFVPSLLFDIPSPGYGLGHSISYLFHGDIIASLKTHPLGIVTVFVLLGRSVYLIKNSLMKGQM